MPKQFAHVIRGHPFGEQCRSKCAPSCMAGTLRQAGAVKNTPEGCFKAIRCGILFPNAALQQTNLSDQREPSLAARKQEGNVRAQPTKGQIATRANALGNPIRDVSLDGRYQLGVREVGGSRVAPLRYRGTQADLWLHRPIGSQDVPWRDSGDLRAAHADAYGDQHSNGITLWPPRCRVNDAQNVPDVGWPQDGGTLDSRDRSWFGRKGRQCSAYSNAPMLIVGSYRLMRLGYPPLPQSWMWAK